MTDFLKRRRASTKGWAAGLLSTNWLRLIAAMLLVWWGSNLLDGYVDATRVAAQEKNPDEVLEEEAAAPAPAASPTKPPPRQRTFVDALIAGGWIGAVIILISFVAVGFIIEHSLSIRKDRLMPEWQIGPLEEMIHQGRVGEAIEFCRIPKNYSLATDVILAGLERFQGSEFGFAEYKSAVEEAGEDNTARLYRKTDALNVIAAIAPMLGLFGTVEGMIESFNAIASTEGTVKPADLADSIGKALVTTWLGLVVAIPAMVAFSYFRNKIDSLISECGKRVERVLMPLGRKR